MMYKMMNKTELETQIKYTKRNAEDLRRYIITGCPILSGPDNDNTRTGKHRAYTPKEVAQAKKTIELLEDAMYEMILEYVNR